MSKRHSLLIFKPWVSLVAGLFLLGCAREDSPSLEQADADWEEVFVRTYFQAANAHDLEAIREMFSPEAEWLLFGDVRRGLDEILAPHEQDVATRTSLEVGEVRSNTDTVWVALTERNDFLSEFGMDSLVHNVRIVIRDSLIIRMEPVEAIDPFDGALGPFFEWVRTEHPEAWAELVGPDGRATYGQRSGELLVELAREYRSGTV